MTKFGSELRKARLAAGLTKDEAAKIIGASASSISKWERGERVPEPLSLPELMRRLPMLCGKAD